ncbi:hypothetical protein O181_130535 [Austropuccinia psidii MF-1]|uniref:Uncharacterized protein n=1 Tax=Austropuccinia psidii MF-1 TaxID=1389203 RepID=A0A9Q3KZ79_9BASI|nr:hypothetical protein [Austropuccinia psidii MF-1]
MLSMGHLLVPSKTGPRGPPIAPTDHRPRHRDHGPWTLGPQEHQMAKKRPYIHEIKKSTQDPEKAKRAINSNLIKIHHRKGQGPNYSGKAKEDSRPYSGISKVIGDKTPLKIFPRQFQSRQRKAQHQVGP